jgi:hypothetical protein
MQQLWFRVHLAKPTPIYQVRHILSLYRNNCSPISLLILLACLSMCEFQTKLRGKLEGRVCWFWCFAEQSWPNRTLQDQRVAFGHWPACLACFRTDFKIQRTNKKYQWLASCFSHICIYLHPTIRTWDPRKRLILSVPRGFCYKFHHRAYCSGCDFKHVCFKCNGAHRSVNCNFRGSDKESPNERSPKPVSPSVANTGKSV